ncbi:unnamed protein product [Gadus morhua 'NCC']
MLEVLWLFCLPILCLPILGQPFPNLCSNERLLIVNRTKNELSKVSEGVNLTLYTPTTTDMQSCGNASLKCFLDEVKVLYIELDVGGESGKSLQDLIKKMKSSLSLLSNYPVPEASCELMSCELHPEMSADSFLHNLGIFLKQMNSSYCRKRYA